MCPDAKWSYCYQPKVDYDSNLSAITAHPKVIYFSYSACHDTEEHEAQSPLS